MAGQKQVVCLLKDDEPEARRTRKGKRKRLTNRDKDPIRTAVFDRDGGCLLDEYSPCFGVLTVHHRRKASQGGGYTLDNLAALCQFHNDEIEADADLAAYCRTVGLVLKAGDPDLGVTFGRGDCREDHRP